MDREPTGGKKFLAYPLSSTPPIKSEPGFACGPSFGGADDPEYVGHFLEWTPDGRHLLFHDGRTIWKVDMQGTELRKVIDANADLSGLGGPDDAPHSAYGHYADISQNGRLLVYSTCEFDTEELADLETWEIWGERAGTTNVWPYPPIREAWGGREAFMYDLAIVDLLDGSQERLTTDAKFDLYPVWSPDGSKIAFINTRYSQADP